MNVVSLAKEYMKLSAWLIINHPKVIDDYLDNIQKEFRMTSHSGAEDYK